MNKENILLLFTIYMLVLAFIIFLSLLFYGCASTAQFEKIKETMTVHFEVAEESNIEQYLVEYSTDQRVWRNAYNELPMGNNSTYERVVDYTPGYWRVNAREREGNIYSKIINVK